MNCLITCIGHDIWIGYEALIMSGINVGNEAIISSRSVVTADDPLMQLLVVIQRE